MEKNIGDHPEPHPLGKIRENPWIISTVFLALFAIIVLVSNAGLPHLGYLINEDTFNVSRYYDGGSIGIPKYTPTLHVYDRLDCYECKKFYLEILPSVINDYVKYGNLRIVFYDFPNFLDDSSVERSRSLRCFLEEDKYFELKNNAVRYDGILDATYFNKKAVEFGLEDYYTCLHSEEILQEIIDDFILAEKKGVRETPTLFLDETPLQQFDDYPSFKEKLDDLLKQ